MVEVEITNYESISHAKIAFEGFCTLVGGNALGKSAILRAINAALTNQTGSSFIKWGETACEVHIKTDYIDILWHKEEDNNYYIINNGPIQKKSAKEGQRQEIIDAGLGLTKVGDTKINLHYCEQYYPLFLVDKRDSKAADLLISIYGLDRLYKGLELCNKDQRENKSLLRTRRDDYNTAKKDMEKYLGFDEILKNKGALIEKGKEREKLEVTLQKLMWQKVSYEELSRKCEVLSTISSIKTPDIKPIRDNLDKINKVVKYKEQIDKITLECAKLEKIGTIEISDQYILDIKDKLNKLNKVKENFEKLKVIVKDIRKIESITTITPIKAPKIDFYLLNKVIQFKKDMDTLISEIKFLEANIEKTNAEKKLVSDALIKYDVCPVCNSKLNN